MRKGKNTFGLSIFVALLFLISSCAAGLVNAIEDDDDIIESGYEGYDDIDTYESEDHSSDTIYVGKDVIYIGQYPNPNPNPPEPIPPNDFITSYLNDEQIFPEWSGSESLPLGFGFYSAIWPAGSWHTTTSDPQGPKQITGLKIFCFLRFPLFNPGPFNAQVDGNIITTWDYGFEDELVLDFDVEWGGWYPGCYLQYLVTLGQVPIFDLFDPYHPYADVGIENIHIDLYYKENGIPIQHYVDTFYDEI